MKLLIIDDEVKASTYLINSLKEFYGCDVEFYKSIKRVLSFTVEELHRFDGILLDIMMPIDDSINEQEKGKLDKGLSTGIFLLEKIREKVATPIVLFTARSNVGYITNKYKNVGYITKPATTEEIFETLTLIINNQIIS